MKEPSYFLIQLEDFFETFQRTHPEFNAITIPYSELVKDEIKRENEK